MTLSKKDTVLITLVGSPNAGKTTLFNYLSGRNFKTVNYPGATVEYSISRFQDKFNLDANLLDSPGIVSLNPNSPDEKISINSLYYHPVLGKPHLLIVTVDTSQLSRHLFLVKQLLECKFKVIVALTMTDILKRKGYNISPKKLSDELNCSVVKIDGRTGNGIPELIKLIQENLLKSESNGDVNPVPYSKIFNKQKLIDSYKEIELINDSVLEEITTEAKQADLKKANRQLRILH